MKWITLFILLTLPSITQAGLFLNLDVGMYLRDYAPAECPPYNVCDTNYRFGHENPVGIVRLGYRYEIVHAYWEHMSSIPNAYDHGIDVFMIGLNFETD